MSNFVCPECGAIISDSPTGYVTGCEHYPIENPKVDQCLGCIYDTDESACSNPLYRTLEFWIPTAPECYTSKKK